MVALVGGMTAIDAGGARTCVLASEGRAKCWGGGYLGDGTTESSATPVDVF